MAWLLLLLLWQEPELLRQFSDYATVPSAQGQATDGPGGCTSECTAMCSAWLVSVPQGKWLRRTLNQATAASHMLSSPFFTDPITPNYAMVCGRPSHFIYDHLFTSSKPYRQWFSCSTSFLSHSLTLIVRSHAGQTSSYRALTDT